MKKYLKLASAVLAIIGVILMFGTQVTVKFATGTSHIGVKALVDGTYPGLSIPTTYTGCYSGIAAYILLGVGAIILALCALTSIKNHDMLSVVLTGLAIVCLIVGMILIFCIRRNFMNDNGLLNDQVIVGWGAIAAGSVAGLSIATGLLSIVFDLSGNN